MFEYLDSIGGSVWEDLEGVARCELEVGFEVLEGSSSFPVCLSPPSYGLRYEFSDGSAARPSPHSTIMDFSPLE